MSAMIGCSLSTAFPRRTLLRLAVLPLLLCTAHPARSLPPRILVVDAHPDDETTYCGAIYKITHDLQGVVDLVVVTNGEGGYKYSTLAEPIYQLKLTDEKIGRRYLPRIRKKELQAAGRVLGLHHIFFLDQKDHRYSTNPHEVLDSTSKVWDLDKVRASLRDILAKGRYDALFTMLPTGDTHGHHQGTTILALDAVKNLAGPGRPVVLGAAVSSKDTPVPTFSGLADYPQTATVGSGPVFVFDRTQSFGFRHALNYKIITNWVIAEHKSQGTMQLFMNSGDQENYWFFAQNDPSGQEKMKALFDRLAVNDYPELTYEGALPKLLPKL